MQTRPFRAPDHTASATALAGGTLTTTVPLLGADSAPILAEAGYSAAEIAALLASGAVRAG